MINVAERKSLFFCLWEQFEAQKAETLMWSKTDELALGVIVFE